MKHTFSHVQRYASLLGGLCLWSAAAPVVWAVPVPLPATGVNASGLETSKLKVDYNPTTRKMMFSAVSAADYADMTSCEASFCKGDNTTLLPVENWKFERHTTPTDWYIIIDESNSMRISKEKRIYLAEAVNVVNQLLKASGRNDTVQVHLVSSEMSELGSTKDRARLNAELNKLRQNASKRQGNTHQLTAIYHYSTKLINSLSPADKAQGRKRMLLLLTDGEDDASAPGESEDLINAANHESRKVAVSCITFFRSTAPRNTQVNTFERICTKTQGHFFFQNSACSDTTAGTLADTLSRRINHPGCSFSINRPENADGAELQLKFRISGNNEASLTLSPETVDTVCKLAAAGTNAETDALVADILKRVSAAGTAIKVLAEAESKEPADPAAVQAAIAELGKHTAELLPVCRELKSKDAAKVKQSIETAGKKSGMTEAEKRALEYLKNLQADTSLKAEQLTDNHMLELLGRTSPLPYPGVNAVQQLLTRITAGAASIKMLAEAEANKTPDLPTISREAFGLRRKAEAMLDAAKQLKNTTEKEQQQALELLLGRSGISEEQKAALQKIRTFCTNKELTADKLTAEHMLELLGRTTPLPTPEADLLKTLRDIISRGTSAAKALAEVEKATPDETELIQKAVAELQPIVRELKEPATTLKTLFAEAVLHTIRTEQAAEGLADTDKEVLARLLSYCENSNITAEQVADEHMLLLLGRDTPLPEPPVEQPPPTWLYPTIGGSAALLLIVGLYAAYVRRKKKLAEQEIIDADIPAEPEPPEPPVKPTKPSIVPAGTPGVAPQTVLAVLDIPGTDNQWWVIEPLVSIGRDENNDLVLAPADRSVSARHCAIKRERNGSWTIYDLGSTNKIFYNDKIHTQLTLTQGITVEIGSVKLRFHMTENNI